MQINFISVGSLKKSYYKSAFSDYIERISHYSKVNIIEVPEHKLSQNPSESEIKKALEYESIKILEKANKSAIIPLAVEGKQLDSVSFSAKLQDIININSTISFIIGSSYGLSSEVLNKGCFLLSLSKMTLPHELARVFLAEQVYRAFSILNNAKYHK